MMDFYMELIRQKPIHYHGLVFYPLEFCEICDQIGLSTFDELLLPFLMTKDCFDIEEHKIDETDFFTDILLNNSVMLHSVAYLLQLHCKCSNVGRTDSTILLNYEDREPFAVTAANYDDICQIIMKINGKAQLKVEKPPKKMSDRQLDVWEKLQSGRKKDSSKNTVHIYDMLNVCEFGGNYHLPMEVMEHWTLWRIMNCYKNRINMKTYDDNLKICLVSGNGDSISDKNHWHQKLMLRD